MKISKEWQKSDNVLYWQVWLSKEEIIKLEELLKK